MYARVTRWEGGEAEAINETVARIRQDAESGPPEGVPGKGFMLLSDSQGGRVLAIALFETEDDYRQGDQKLNEMSPPGDGMGNRVSVEKYEVGVDVET